LALVLLPLESLAVFSFLSLAFICCKLKPAQLNILQKKMKKHKQANSIAIVPLALPLLAGPGTISSVIVLAHKTQSLTDKLGLSIVIILLGSLIFITYSFAPAIGKLLGKTGMNIVTRLMGLITMAMAVEFMANGLEALFPGWK
jgi:multiple antibiotic resistance protein